MNTEISASASWRLAALRWNLITKTLLVLGRIQAAIQSGRELLQNIRQHENDKQNGRLTPEQIAKLTAYQVSRVGGDYRKRIKYEITEEALAKPLDKMPMQHKGASLLERVLKDNPTIRSVANIGARVDVTSSYLARKFPNVTFTSIDFQPDLKGHNAPLPQSPNWHFMTGYALDLIERGEIAPDLVFMTSTACLFSSREMDEFVAVWAKASVRYVVLNEPWWPKLKTLDLRITLPEQVPVDDPYCSGKHGHYHYNYAAKLARGGYKTTFSRLIAGPERGCYCLQMIANAG